MKILVKTLVSMAIIFSADIIGQSNFQNFINRISSIVDSTAKVTVIDSFINYARGQGIPFIEGNTANFIFRGSAATVQVAGDFNGWNPSAASMIRLYKTNFLYYSKDFELNARLDYKFVTNGGTWILDPENPNRVAGGFGPNSELAMPGYIQPWEIKYKSNINHGSIKYSTIHSISTSANYQLQIYLPYGYDSSKSYPAVYFQDGSEYVNLGSAINVIDNLIDSGKIEDIIAVFVTPTNRNEEYAGSTRDQYRMFFVNELVPHIDSNYRTIQNPKKRLVLGDSFGGNISALISYNHPDVFGNCGLHSGAFWPNSYEAYNLIVNGPVKDIKFSSVWGTYESLFTNMRGFRDSLQSKGYEYEWLELPEGHSWGLWRANTDVLLTYFFPKQATKIQDEVNAFIDFKLFPNYPNPVNPTTKISWQSSIGSWQTIKVYDVLGSEVAVLVDEWKDAGHYEVEFHAGNLSSGVYLYRISINGFIETMKMMVVK